MYRNTEDEMSNFLVVSKWFYRGEGNKTLVISNPESRKVLRLQKSPVILKDRANPTEDATQKKSDVRRQEFEQSIKLCKQIFVPLLGEKYVQPGVIVELPKEFMTKIKDLVTSNNKERPNFRLTKEVDIGSKFGVLMSDFCFVSGDRTNTNEVEHTTTTPTFCVEIKPKCGTLPVCTELENSTYRKVKESICKYCLLQWMKVNKEGKYLQRSGYCPLDLFSADINRVWYSLLCLLKSPQNNLRIFQDGKLVYSEEIKAPSYSNGQLDNGSNINKTSTKTIKSTQFPDLLPVEEILSNSFATYKKVHHFTTCRLNDDIDDTNLLSTTMFLATLLQLLIHDSNESMTESHQHSSKHPVCKASCHGTNPNHLTSIPTCLTSKGLAFGKGGVLGKILDVQKLDRVGSDKAFSIFNDLCASGCEYLIDSHIFTWDENIKCNINKIAEINTCHNMNTPECFNADKSLCIPGKLDHLTKFLIAASANDCSVMISFQEVVSENPTNFSVFKDALTGLIYQYQIAIVDLDQKESDRIPKYYQEYHTIVDNYLHFSSI